MGKERRVKIMAHTAPTYVLGNIFSWDWVTEWVNLFGMEMYDVLGYIKKGDKKAIHSHHLDYHWRDITSSYLCTQQLEIERERKKMPKDITLFLLILTKCETETEDRGGGRLSSHTFVGLFFVSRSCIIRCIYPEMWINVSLWHMMTVMKTCVCVFLENILALHSCDGSCWKKYHFPVQKCVHMRAFLGMPNGPKYTLKAHPLHTCFHKV